MFQHKSTILLFSLCSALAACHGAPARDLTAPDSEAGALDAKSVNPLAPSNTWAGKAALPGDRPRYGRSQLKASSLDNFIYVFGGSTVQTPTSTRVDAYNITTNTWSPRAQLPSARRMLSGASTINRLIYVTGGRNRSSELTKTLYVYDAATNSWVEKATCRRPGAAAPKA